MDAQILVGLLLTILPVSELRGGLPVIVEYCLRNGVSVWPYFLLVVALNILVIFFIFLFFDFLHGSFMRLRTYRFVVGKWIDKTRKKAIRVKERFDKWGYFALMLFVAVPLPGTGAWTGTFVAWILGLDRKKSFAAIAAGVVVAGALVLFASLGLLSWFY